MPRAKGLVQILPLRERENARGIRDAVALENDAAIVDRVVREENGLQHLGRRLAINPDAGFNGFLELDGLLDGDERADPDLGEAFAGLDDDFNVLALL